MYETNDSFGTQVDAMFSTWKFTTCSGAFALFYWGPGAKTGLRLEVGFLAKEFVDDVHWGTDPEGLIFYKTPEDFNISGDVQYKVTKNKDTTPSIRVDFFKSGVDINGKDSVPFSSFITKDTTELSKDLLANYVKSGKGQWKDQQTGTSYGNLTKSADNTTAMLKLTPIGKQITWTVNESKSCNVTGTFTFYKSGDLSTSTSATADWNPDRVLFHNGNSFYGAFYPSSKIPFTDSKPTSEPSISVSSI